MSTWREDISNYIIDAVHHHLTEDSPQAEQPDSVSVALRPHQLSLLAAARGLERKARVDVMELSASQLLTRYGVLADRVGAGKSLVALSLVRDPPVEQSQFTLREGGTARIIGIKHLPACQEFLSEWADLSGAQLFKAMGVGNHITSSSQKFYTRASIMIVPHNVAQQWETYIKEQMARRFLTSCGPVFSLMRPIPSCVRCGHPISLHVLHGLLPDLG